MQSTYLKPETTSDKIRKLSTDTSACKECNLYCNTNNSVPPVWRGKLDNINIMFIGEGPGANEDKVGKPFVGAAGALLQNTLYDLNIIDDIYITNVVKHRPPKNRKPTYDEMSVCGKTFLQKEIELIQPRHIVCLGRTAAEYLMALAKIPGHIQWMGSLRGKNFKYKGVKVTCTWHPAYILRKPEKLSELKEDLIKLT